MSCGASGFEDIVSIDTNIDILQKRLFNFQKKSSKNNAEVLLFDFFLF